MSRCARTYKDPIWLFELAPTLHFTTGEIKKQRESFGKGEESCVNRFRRLYYPV